MPRLILIIALLLASLVNFFPVPAVQFWYVGIAVPEYPWIFIIVCLALLTWSWYAKKFRPVSLVLGSLTFLILCYPIISAYVIGSGLQSKLNKEFGVDKADMKGFYQQQPFSFLQMFTGNAAKKIPFTTYHYSSDTGKASADLTLNFYKSVIPGTRPCLMEVHGGSWKHGDNSELAHFNEYMANCGYHVASINYRLAPQHPSPAQREDMHQALEYLRFHAGELEIDTSKFLLSGRSAGAQLVLALAYSGRETGIKGVAAFYGPTDMMWTWQHPDNPLIMDSRQVQRDFLGGEPHDVPARYVQESPLYFANKQTIPTLLVHGKNDAHVYYEQSERLSHKLDSLGVPNYLLSLPWATHGCEYNLNGPSGQLAMFCVNRFFTAVTK